MTSLARQASARRRELGLTQVELADLAGVGVSSVRSVEAGSDTLTLAVALRILAALGLRADAISDE